MAEIKRCCVAARALTTSPGLGPVGLRAMYGEYGDWEVIAELKGLGKGGKARGQAELELGQLYELGGWSYCLGESDFPLAIEGMPDGPICVSGMGMSMNWQAPMVAVVGSRECSQAGLEITRTISQRLVESGVVVVSGMARGIDEAAHRAALRAGGQTVAVWGSGLAVARRQNSTLFAEIEAGGCHVSQFPLHLAAQPYTFPIRNRVIAGLSEAVIVVEAGHKSGSLLTAEAARVYGRKVLAVPGSVFDGRSRGTNWLIEQGAEIVVDVNGIVEKLGMEGLGSVKRQASRGMMREEERVIWKLLAESPLGVDELVRGSGLGVAEVSEILLNLELMGRVRQFGEVYRIV